MLATAFSPLMVSVRGLSDHTLPVATTTSSVSATCRTSWPPTNTDTARRGGGEPEVQGQSSMGGSGGTDREGSEGGKGGALWMVWSSFNLLV